MNQKSSKWIVLGVVAGALTMFSFTGGGVASLIGNEPVHAEALAPAVKNTITVTGKGELKVEPDVAYISFGVATKGKTANEAQKANAAAYNKLTKVLFEQYKLAAADVKTSSFQVQPEYNYSEKEQKLIGYTANHMVQVTFRKIDGIGALLDAVSAVGANRVDHIQFDTEKKDEYELQALEKAMANAEGKAAVLAKASKRELKGVSNIIQQGAQAAPVYLQTEMLQKSMVADQAGGTSIQSGQITITTNVSVQFDF
ncbi:hypothetical protein SY83_11825 [Paenibacillus swuensis]|uniref:DUF541 domain-containing protein n=1 Tax=Paenibacillus swuensis TaxID=1178515 RepID=A0A172TIF9_9BACL|nr:SIMPL domain-containing protein [Paenibacillus swuensis]ANE46849.1 hypothetical protein SY83_11825 [Paenibacillus swuensis]